MLLYGSTQKSHSINHAIECPNEPPFTSHKQGTSLSRTHASVPFLQKLKSRQARVRDSTTCYYYYFIAACAARSLIHLPAPPTLLFHEGRHIPYGRNSNARALHKRSYVVPCCAVGDAASDARTGAIDSSLARCSCQRITYMQHI